MPSTRTLTGTLRRVDLGPGAWTLDADDGETWHLVGIIPETLDGRRVQVTGRQADLFSFAMTGRSFEVESIRGL